MVSLKKNDKIIVILAVAVLVIAGVGIAAYIPPKSINIGNNPVTDTYHVTWRTYSGTFPLSDDFYAGKKEPYTKDIIINQENLLSVKIEVTWTDDHTYGLLRKKGQDTLSLDVTSKGQTKNQKQIGNGTMEISFTINTVPTIDTISADSRTAAEEQIRAQYYDNTDQSYTIDVSVKTGERIFRLFKYLKDKGNDFNLKITYTYYDAQITETQDEIKNTDNTNDQNTDDAWEPPYLSMILKTGCGRYI